MVTRRAEMLLPRGSAASAKSLEDICSRWLGCISRGKPQGNRQRGRQSSSNGLCETAHRRIKLSMCFTRKLKSEIEAARDWSTRQPFAHPRRGLGFILSIATDIKFEPLSKLVLKADSWRPVYIVYCSSSGRKVRVKQFRRIRTTCLSMIGRQPSR